MTNFQSKTRTPETPLKLCVRESGVPPDWRDSDARQKARPTVDRYLDLLEQTFVIFRLPSFSTNPRKEIARSQKVFFWDTGIRNALLNAFATEELRPDIGAV